MRLAVISDVHGNLPALRRVITHLQAQSVDSIVNLGDCVSAPLWPQETFDALQELNAPTVRGNHDRWLGDPSRLAESPTVGFTASRLMPAALRWLVDLPASIQEGPVLAVHGNLASDCEYLLEESVNDRLCLATTDMLGQRLAGTMSEVVLCGHSHQQNCAWAPGRRLVVNPGAVGGPRYAGNRAPSLNEAGSPHARYAVVTRRNGQWSADLFALDYDWDAVAARARAMGREDWAVAFLKGA